MKLNISVDEILKQTEGKLVQGDSIIINNISTDTRTIQKNDFFVAIEGENFDGHDFAVEAYKKGALGIMVSIIKLNAVLSTFKKEGFPKLVF